MFKGSFVALITPFDETGAVDYIAFEKLIEWHLDQGTHGLVPCGTTGETPTLSEEEQLKLIKTCVDIVDSRIPVIAGAGSNATPQAIERAKRAQDVGVDGILTVVPYYNKPCQDGIFEHFKSIHDAVTVPMVLYDVPGRTVAKFTVDTVCRLAELPHIVGLKDATADLSLPLEMRVRIGDDFALLSGEDATIAAYLAQGGHGCISVTANVAPKLCAELHNAWQDQDLKTFTARRDRLSYLHDLMFRAPNPAPAKYALSKMGWIQNELRLPMRPAPEHIMQKLDKELMRLELI